MRTLFKRLLLLLAFALSGCATYDPYYPYPADYYGYPYYGYGYPYYGYPYYGYPYGSSAFYGFYGWEGGRHWGPRGGWDGDWGGRGGGGGGGSGPIRGR